MAILKASDPLVLVLGWRPAPCCGLQAACSSDRFIGSYRYSACRTTGCLGGPAFTPESSDDTVALSYFGRSTTGALQHMSRYLKYSLLAGAVLMAVIAVWTSWFLFTRRTEEF